MGIERVDSDGEKTMSGKEPFSMLKSLFLLEDPDLVSPGAASMHNRSRCFVPNAVGQRTYLFFLAQSSRAGTKVHGARVLVFGSSPSREVQQLL